MELALMIIDSFMGTDSWTPNPSQSDLFNVDAARKHEDSRRIIGSALCDDFRRKKKAVITASGTLNEEDNSCYSK
jgi:hypothetical protein